VLGRAFARRAAVVVVAAVTGVVVASMVGAASGRGPTVTRSVVVASRDLPPGTVVTDEAVALRELPLDAVAEAAMSDIPVGSVVRYPIVAGEAVVPDRLAPEGLSGTAALVPPSHRAVAVPLGPTGAPPLQPGDRVDIVTFTPDLAPIEPPAEPSVEPSLDDVTGDPGSGTSEGIVGSAERQGPAVALATGAPVVDANDSAITVAVPTPVAPTVAWAAAQGLVALTLVGA
jgi:hypothetical protein